MLGLIMCSTSSKIRLRIRYSYDASISRTTRRNKFPTEDGCILGCYALMIEAVSTSETSVNYFVDW
jgi:hypothetical protein